MPRKADEGKRSIRIPDDVWQRLQWLAKEQRTTRSRLIRRLCDAATRNVKPPQPPKPRELGGITEKEWREWSDIAVQNGQSVDDLLRRFFQSVG